MVSGPKISIIETRSPSSAFLYSVIFAILLVLFLSYWYWFAVNYGPWFPTRYDTTKYSSTNFNTLYPTATETLTVPTDWINGRVYLLDQLALEASTGYMVVVIPPATSLKIGDRIEFVAQQTLNDTSADQNLTQYFGFFEKTELTTDFNSGMFAILYANKNYPNTPASHSDKLNEDQIKLQVFDFGSGKVWVPFGGFSDNN